MYQVIGIGSICNVSQVLTLCSHLLIEFTWSVSIRGVNTVLCYTFPNNTNCNHINKVVISIKWWVWISLYFEEMLIITLCLFALLAKKAWLQMFPTRCDADFSMSWCKTLLPVLSFQLVTVCVYRFHSLYSISILTKV